MSAPKTSLSPLFRYRAFGLEIASDLELCELAPSITDDRIDLTISKRPLARPVPSPGEPGYFVYEPEEQYLAWHEVGGFLIRGVSHIDIDANPNAPAALLSFPLLGPVIALLLHLRGALVLHGSALSRADKCIVLLGDKGAGKSTTAAMLMAQGFSLLADDVVCVQTSASGAPLIAPAFPQLKLSNEAEAALRGPQFAAQAKPLAAFPKVPVRSQSLFAHEARPPTHIYRLHRAASASIEPLSAPEALRTIMRFSFLPLFERRQWRKTPEESVRHFQQCASLSNACRVGALHAPKGLHRGSELCSVIDQDLTQTPGAAL